MSKIYCDSMSACWGDGTCDSYLNSEKFCHDGGDCNYRYKNTSTASFCAKDQDLLKLPNPCNSKSQECLGNGLCHPIDEEDCYDGENRAGKNLIQSNMMIVVYFLNIPKLMKILYL